MNWIKSSARNSMISVGVFIGVAALAGAPSGVASAAGSGYGQTPPPSAAAGGFTSIVTARTLGVRGGRVTGHAFGATTSVTVPAGSLPKGGEVVLSAGPLKSIKTGKGITVVADVSVVVLNSKTGAKLPGPFRPAITVVIRDPSIVPGDFVVTVSGAGKVTTVPGARVSKGTATITFTRDPNFAVVHRK